MVGIQKDRQQGIDEKDDPMPSDSDDEDEDFEVS